MGTEVGRYVEDGAQKFLCMCDGGNVRSHALAFKLKWVHHQEAIAVGRLNVKADTLNMLYEWADHIIVMQPHMTESIPESYHHKVKVVDVGVDHWGVYVHPELNDMVTQASYWLLGKTEPAANVVKEEEKKPYQFGV